MKESSKKLNLGCAGYPKDGYVNVDWLPELKPEIVHDLNKFPYPLSLIHI